MAASRMLIASGAASKPASVSMPGSRPRTAFALTVELSPANERMNSPSGRSRPPLRALPMWAKTSLVRAAVSYQCADAGSPGSGLRQASGTVGL
jgi:hypothetical protein